MQQAAEMSVAAPTIEASLDGRFVSGLKDERVKAAKFYEQFNVKAPSQLVSFCFMAMSCILWTHACTAFNMNNSLAFSNLHSRRSFHHGKVRHAGEHAALPWFLCLWVCSGVEPTSNDRQSWHSYRQLEQDEQIFGLLQIKSVVPVC